MDIPASHDPRWREVVTGKRVCSFDYLALKVFLISAKMDLGRDPSEATVKRVIGDFRTLFEKNISNPKVANDLRKIFF